MANKKAAKKYILKTKRNNLRNNHYKSLMKTVIKKAEQALASKDKDATACVRLALRQIDITSGKGIIHKNAGARKKSALAKKLTLAS